MLVSIDYPHPPDYLNYHVPLRCNALRLDYAIQHLLYHLNVLESNQWSHEDPYEDGEQPLSEWETELKEIITRYAEESAKKA